MANKYNSIAEINAEKESWRIMVRIAHLWMVSDVSTNKQTSSNKIPFSMEMVLMDSKGDRVHGSIKRTLIYKFDKTLQEEKVNSIQFFGVVRNVDIYIESPTTNKIHLQNCICGTRVVSNAECEEVKELATRMFESPSQGLSQMTDSTALSMSEDFLHNTIRKTIGGLKDCFEVFGIVKHVLDNEEWWYTACTCNKLVYHVSKMYRIKVRVIDESDSVTFVIFERDATILFYKPCTNTFEIYQKDLMTKFSNVVENDSQCARKNMEDADKQLEGLQFENVKTNENSRLKGKTNIVEPMQSQSLEMHLPLKSLKKGSRLRRFDLS
ncbi:hypothetical protein D0Y65_003669 [Glycine soja]|uniref:Replication protein A 70 kDa DNA-binding subunit B/D first OB fold domain-containing protein n=1 Tax=Glycine soja TaxID=3848 RepID=A0A445LN21_GLYSO|nr:hypothetical protein D0Y65_003669 [Glycine soja]